MRARRILLAAVTVMTLCSPAFAQARRIMGGGAGGTLHYFFYDTFLDPADPGVTGLGGGTLGGEGVIHRFMFDRNQRVYFGYDVLIESVPEPNVFRVTFSHLTWGADDMRQILGADASSWSQLATPDWGGSAVRNIQAGEVLALDLLTNSATGQKIVDYVTVQKPSSKPPSKLGPWPRDFVYETGMPRDFRAEDAELRIEMEGITVNGNMLPFNGGVSGAAVFFYLPMHGRFILSLTPHPELGFRQAGEVRGSTISLASGDLHISIVSTGRIAPGSGPFNLFVLHEPEWVPRNPRSTTNVVIGAADRLEHLVGSDTKRPY